MDELGHSGLGEDRFDDLDGGPAEDVERVDSEDLDSREEHLLPVGSSGGDPEVLERIHDGAYEWVLGIVELASQDASGG